MVYNETYENTEYGHFKDVMVNHCLLHEIEMDFKYTHKSCKEKLQALNIEKDCENNYEHSCVQGLLGNNMVKIT